MIVVAVLSCNSVFLLSPLYFIHLLALSLPFTVCLFCAFATDIMPPKINVRDRLDGNTIDLSLADLQEVPVREIVSMNNAVLVTIKY